MVDLARTPPTTLTTPTTPTTPPLFDTPPALTLPDGGFQWWLTTEPWGIASRVPGPRGRFTLACANLLSDVGYPLALKHRPPNSPRMTIVHDWRNVVAYDAAARSAMVEAAKVQKEVLGPVYLLLGPQMPPLVMMGIELATLALRPLGMDITVLRDETALRKHLPNLRAVTP